MERQTIAQIKALNRSRGGHFFDPETLRFFNSVIYPNVRTGRNGWFFVTGERPPGRPTRYTVRKCLQSGKIKTVGDFQQYASFEGALSAAIEAAKQED